MNRHNRWVIAMMALALVCVFGGLAEAETASGESALRVGAASAAVNPDVGTFLGGYNPGRMSTGVHDDLHAKAVVFDDGASAVALVAVDALSLQYPTVEAIRAVASERVKGIALPPDRIMVQATHSHAAPDTIGIYGNLITTGVDEAYMERLVSTCGGVVAQAAANLAPATLVYAATECVGWAVNDSEAEILDNSVTILACLGADGKPLATLTNFACHPTVLDGDNTLTGSDWVWAFYRDMAAKLPGEHLFLQGSVGCWVQPKTPERSFSLAEKYGKDLAEKVLGALEKTQPVKGTAIRCASHRFEMPVPNPVFRSMSSSGLVSRDFGGEGAATEVAWFAVGDAQFATHLGETAPEYTLQTRELMDSEPKFVLGLGLDHLGYICPERYYDKTDEIPHATYLVRMSPGREAGAAMMAALKKVIP